MQLRRGIGYVIQSVGLMPHQTIERNIATVPQLLGWDEERIAERTRSSSRSSTWTRRSSNGTRASSPGGQRPAGRRRARARRRPAGDADGRAVRRRRPHRARASAGRVPGDPAPAAEDDRVRHARRRRGDQARRPDLHPQHRRRPRAVRAARGDPAGPGERLRRGLRRRRAGAQAPGADQGGRHPGGGGAGRDLGDAGRRGPPGRRGRRVRLDERRRRRRAARMGGPRGPSGRVDGRRGDDPSVQRLRDGAGFAAAGARRDRDQPDPGGGGGERGAAVPRHPHALAHQRGDRPRDRAPAVGDGAARSLGLDRRPPRRDLGTGGRTCAADGAHDRDRVRDLVPARPARAPAPPDLPAADVGDGDPLHDPEPCTVRRTPADHGARVHDGADRTGELHAPDLHPQHRRRPGRGPGGREGGRSRDGIHTASDPLAGRGTARDAGDRRRCSDRGGDDRRPRHDHGLDRTRRVRAFHPSRPP